MNLLDSCVRVLSTTTARWQSLIDTLPDDLLTRPPAPGEWSALDCLRHLLVSERHLLQVRLRHFLEGRPELVPYDPAAARQPEPAQTPAELVAAFAAARRETMALLDQVQPADLARTSYHPQYMTEVRLEHLLNLWAAHDLEHTVQAEQALMQPFIPGTGVWRAEFAAHES